MSKRILLGEIVSVHGIRGEVVIRSYAETPISFESYGALSDQSGARTYSIKVVRSGPKGVVARVEGVTDRNAAEALQGTKLFVERSQLPPASADEFYHADLMGLTAFDAAGTLIGKITGVHNYGAGDFLEVERPDAESEYVPFSNDFVIAIDLSKGQVTLNLPPPGPDDSEMSPEITGQGDEED